ncbi:MAG: amidohydrolase family protein [Lautropia sp.]|nr:amidohydrolase family protein [Lautropia sp.]
MMQPDRPWKIDTHQHFWSYQPEQYPWMASDGLAPLRRDFLPDDLAPVIQPHQVDATIAVQARGEAGETAFLLSLARHTPWIVGVIGWIDLRAPDIGERLAECAPQHPREGDRLLGFRHQVQDEPDASQWLLHESTARGLDALQRAGFVYELLFLPSQLGELARIVDRHDAHTLVLDHLGKPPIARMQQDASAFSDWQASLAPLRHTPHVMLKLSGLVTEADWQRGLDESAWGWIRQCLDSALELVGPSRLLWGSDWPVCTLAAPYEEVFQRFDDWARTRLSADEQQALWADNARRCYRLP